MKAEQVKEKILKAKGQMLRVRWESHPKPSAQFKHIDLKKVTTAVIRSGLSYDKLASVIESEKEVGPLPWGEWRKGSEKYIIDHKGEEYIRLYCSPNENHIPKSEYFINGNQVNRDVFLEYLTPSAAAKQDERVECFTIKADNLLDINEDN